MGKISLARVDFRLIHGQIVTKWRTATGINKIVVIDNILAEDDFMIKIYTSAAPAGTKTKVHSEEKALRLWNKNKFGEDADVLILFKDLDTCYRAVKAGIGLTEIQLGGIPITPERKSIKKAVALGEKEISYMQELHDNYGVNFTIQVVPEDTKMEYDEILKVYHN